MAGFNPAGPLPYVDHDWKDTWHAEPEPIKTFSSEFKKTLFAIWKFVFCPSPAAGEVYAAFASIALGFVALLGITFLVAKILGK